MGLTSQNSLSFAPIARGTFIASLIELLQDEKFERESAPLGSPMFPPSKKDLKPLDRASSFLQSRRCQPCWSCHHSCIHHPGIYESELIAVELHETFWSCFFMRYAKYSNTPPSRSGSVSIVRFQSPRASSGFMKCGCRNVMYMKVPPGTKTRTTSWRYRSMFSRTSSGGSHIDPWNLCG